MDCEDSKIVNYNSSLLNKIYTNLIDVVDFTNFKVFPTPFILSKPEPSYLTISSKELAELINVYVEKCDSSFDSIKDMDFGYLIQSKLYENIINLKNIDSFLELKPLYDTNYVLDYNSEISIKNRNTHTFNIPKFHKFSLDLENSFRRGVFLLSNNTFDIKDIKYELSGINYLFWNYCSIKAIFQHICNELDLIIILNNLVIKVEDFERNIKRLRYNKTNNEIIKMASSGGKKKAENQAKQEAHIREQAIQMYRAQHPTLNRSWKSRNEFVSYFLSIENSKRNLNDLISDATVKRWIKESLNE